MYYFWNNRVHNWNKNHNQIHYALWNWYNPSHVAFAGQRLFPIQYSNNLAGKFIFFFSFVHGSSRFNLNQNMCVEAIERKVSVGCPFSGQSPFFPGSVSIVYAEYAGFDPPPECGGRESPLTFAWYGSGFIFRWFVYSISSFRWTPCESTSSNRSFLGRYILCGLSTIEMSTHRWI